MTLHPPFEISARLLPAVRVGDSWISVEWSDRPGDDGRARAEYHIDTPDWEYSADDLQSGCGGGNLQEMMESLLAFLGAAAEAYQYVTFRGGESDNADLFPAHVMEWAYQHSDELAGLECELQDGGALLTE